MADVVRATQYSLCETAYAGPSSLWHIRRLTSCGKKLGGGVDTNSLCGKKVAWDLDVEITGFHLKNNTCGQRDARFCEESR